MHTRLLTYFEAIIRHGSIRKAAEAVHVAPSAINRHLLELEAQLGTPLFERLPRGLRPTAAGEILARHIRSTLRDYDKAVSEIEQLATGLRGRIVIASIESALADLLPMAVKGFADLYPRIDFDIRSCPAEEAIRQATDGSADLALIFNPPPRLSLVQVAYADFPLGVICAPDHPLTRLPAVQLSNLLGYQLLLPARSITIADQLDMVLSTTGLKLPSRMVSNSLTFMSSYVQSGEAISIMTPIGILDRLKAGDLAFLPLTDRGLLPQRLIAGVADASMPVAVANFCGHLKGVLRQVATSQVS
ncbi:LysR family transcriptional regulator [uncultured Roseibium sp.]|uniref:LysR family transcriptional regulator n=1 Tax=uncultured Roseibium sp. TaxID=1936171 RepID=UPI003217CAA3